MFYPHTYKHTSSQTHLGSKGLLMGHLALFHAFLSRQSKFPCEYPIAAPWMARICGYAENFFRLLLLIQLAQGNKWKMVEPKKLQSEFPYISLPSKMGEA